MNESYDQIITLMPIEVLVYLRKSRSDNPDESVEEVLERHEMNLQMFAEQKWGMKIPEENIFREVVSGETIEARPMIQTVMQMIELPNYKAVLVIEPQRLSRGDLEDCGRIINAFRYSNTLVITPPKTYNLNDKYDRKFFEMELTRGNDFLEYIKEIMSRGRITSVMKGHWIGNTAPYGYRRTKIDGCHSLEADPDEAPALKKIFDMYVNEDLGFHTIAMRLDQMGIPTRTHKENWNPATLQDIIKNPVYIGKIRWNYRATKKVMVDGKVEKTRPEARSASEYILVDGLHDPLISEKIWNAAQEKRGRTTRKKASTKVRNPLSGLLYCSCGKAMSYRRYLKNGAERSAPRLLCTNQHNCHIRSVLYSEMIETVADVLRNSIKDFEIRLKNDEGNSVAVHQQLISNLEAELEKLNQKDERQKDLLEDGIYSKEDFLKRNAKLHNRIEEVKQALCEAHQTMPESIDYENKIRTFSEVVEMMETDDADPAELNRLLKSIIERIDYTNTAKTTRRKGFDRQKGGWEHNNFSIDVHLRI